MFQSRASRSSAAGPERREHRDAHQIQGDRIPHTVLHTCDYTWTADGRAVYAVTLRPVIGPLPSPLTGSQVSQSEHSVFSEMGTDIQNLGQRPKSRAGLRC